MKIFTHNFDPRSDSGPNKFSRQLLGNLIKTYDHSLSTQEESDIEFCLIQQVAQKLKPLVLRLDGIYFNKIQDYNQQNTLINFSYKNADAVIFQSKFNKELTEKWFGMHQNSHIVHNAYLENVITDTIFKKDANSEIWSCASSWRPHKRLVENVRYFFENAPNNTTLYIAGGGVTDAEITSISELSKLHDRTKKVKICGNIDYLTLRMLYDASSTFIHLAYLDHCPNVVVDAVAHGCHVICSSSGGTKEIIRNGTIIIEDEWDFSPINLYDPPKLDFSKRIQSMGVVENLASSKLCLEKYDNIFRSIL